MSEAVDTVHAEEHLCPVTACALVGKALSSRQALMNHINGWHTSDDRLRIPAAWRKRMGVDACPEDGCSVIGKQLKRHSCMAAAPASKTVCLTVIMKPTSRN